MAGDDSGPEPVAYAATMGRRRRQGRGLIGRILVILAGLMVTGLAAAPAAYMLWPISAPVVAVNMIEPERWRSICWPTYLQQ